MVKVLVMRLFDKTLHYGLFEFELNGKIIFSDVVSLSIYVIFSLQRKLLDNLKW